MPAPHRHFVEQIWTAAGGIGLPPVSVSGTAGLPSCFAVTDLATAAIGAAGAAIAELIASGGAPRTVVVDRSLCCHWFGVSIRPEGWVLPPGRDAVAGDYATRDGWIRLHTNAPHHREVALYVLGAEADREAVARAVRRWTAEALETAIVTAGGCAAAMRPQAQWAAHPQGSSVAAESLIARDRHDGAGAERASDERRPLAGIKVLDLTRVLAGPVATRFLAGFGAEVLRIDPPFWQEKAIEPDLTLGKHCARLDLRDPAARERLRTLLAGADMIVHGYRPGALEGLGLGAAERRRLRPGLIDVSLDAYGWTGPWAGRRGFDSLVQMSSGIADTGMREFGRDRPTPLPVQALDHATGYILATAAIRALTEQRRDGKATIGRASLARTAALLTSVAASGAETARPVTDAEFAPEFEQTEWGPARRLRPPLQIEGLSMRWDHPAGSLGASPAEWASAG